VFSWEKIIYTVDIYISNLQTTKKAGQNAKTTEARWGRITYRNKIYRKRKKAALGAIRYTVPDCARRA